MKTAYLLLLPCAFFAHAEVQINDQFKYYPVKSNNSKMLLNDVNKATPITQDGEVFHGFTEYFINWNYQWNEQRGKCSITEVKVTIDINITLPELHSSSQQVKDIWQQWLPNLKLHEIGHREIGVLAAQKIEQGIYDLPSFASCGKLEKEANALGMSFLKQADELSAYYDKTTHHGETQGAWLYKYL